MKDQIIFIAGIHGVGKTTLCHSISKELEINAYSSSDLIRKFKNIDDNEKIVESINSNQDILLESIKLNINEEKDYILDGHFILMDKDYSFKEVPLKTFIDIRLKYIVILYEDIDIIVKRLNDRDGSNYRKEFIEEFQRKEIDRGKEVAQSIGKPYIVINSSDYNEVLIKV